jgi:hypothetical protein
MPGETEETSSYLVESYWPGVSVEKLTAAAGRARHATNEARARGSELHFLGSMLIPADETVFWFFTGEEAEVRSVSEQAGVPFERILGSLRIDGEQQKEER